MSAPRLLTISCAFLTALCAPLAGQEPDFPEVRKLAEAGNAVSQYNLGVAYAHGKKVNKDEAEAAKWYRKAADQGHAEAQFWLGSAYASGNGVTKDQSEAVKWYRKAADQGNANAQFWLGLAYSNGDGLKKDEKEAINWLRKAANQAHGPAQSFLEIMNVPFTELIKKSRKEAAEQGDPEAQFELGKQYAEGKDIPQDYVESAKWYRKAADQGHAIAQYGLGLAYYNANGVARDYAEAVKWFRRAADQGIALAQSNLGVMYARGEGVPKDDIEAYAWYNLAAVSNETARKNRDSAARRLPSGARILGQKRTKEIQQEIENREIERLKKEDQKRREKIQKGA
jgi:TPR repeat protein